MPIVAIMIGVTVLLSTASTPLCCPLAVLAKTADKERNKEDKVHVKYTLLLLSNI